MRKVVCVAAVCETATDECQKLLWRNVRQDGTAVDEWCMLRLDKDGAA
jgi:hypothetical protein